MDITMIIEQTNLNSNQSKKVIFSELTSNLFHDVNNEINLSSLRSKFKEEIIKQIKTLKIIELNNLESFYKYVNYDHYLIFKFNNDYYFCETDLVPALKLESMIKINDFNNLLRKDKINKINEKTI